MSSDIIINKLKSKKRNSLLQKPLSRAEVLYAFEKLRQKQRQLVADLADNEIKLKEFTEVIKTLKSVDSRRRCFLSMSSMLVDLEIREAYPLILLEKQSIIGSQALQFVGSDILEQNQFIEDRIEDLTTHLQWQTKAVQDFQRAHDIRIRSSVDSGMKTE